jgi:quinol monooxygenase YgiN
MPEPVCRWTGQRGPRRYRALSLLSHTMGTRMNQRLITSVSAVVEPERETELTSGFRELVDGTMPAGLLRTELLRGQNGTWRIQSLWRDREALMAARDSAEPPAALELFRRVGADHTHEVFIVEESHER